MNKTMLPVFVSGAGCFFGNMRRYMGRVGIRQSARREISLGGFGGWHDSGKCQGNESRRRRSSRLCDNNRTLHSLAAIADGLPGVARWPGGGLRATSEECLEALSKWGPQINCWEECSRVMHESGSLRGWTPAHSRRARTSCGRRYATGQCRRRCS